jgi:hypothetical protein
LAEGKVKKVRVTDGEGVGVETVKSSRVISPEKRKGREGVDGGGRARLATSSAGVETIVSELSPLETLQILGELERGITPVEIQSDVDHGGE